MLQLTCNSWLLREGGGCGQQVKDPDSVDHSVFEQWVASHKGSTPLIHRLGGGGSDFVAFLQHAGVPALDLQFGDDDYPMYHTAYDNFHWMEKFGDPLFHRHVAVTTLLGLMAMRLSSDALLPLDFVTYAKELEVILVQSCVTTDCTKSLELLYQSTLCKFNVSK
jgi:N-acetylated-alpha-linked acidic dipeptidase